MSKNDDQTINEIIRLMQTDTSTDAPLDAIQWSKNIFRARVIEPKKSVFQKVLAVLQMDLSSDKAAFGERSGSNSQARQMLFRAGENALDIRIARTEKGFNLYGQILGEGYANGTAKLSGYETDINELGEFKLAEIPEGNYNLSVQKGEKEIAIEVLELN